MPATTQVQQMAAGAELRRRREGGGGKRFASLPTSKLKHFASTRRKGLPYRAAKNRKERRRQVAALRAGGR